jgi:hypothetical protein
MARTVGPIDGSGLAELARRARGGDIGQLPRSQREVVALFYLGERSQAEVAAFLGLPVSTVNNRLHAARTNLKKGTLREMSTIGPETLPADFAERVGRVLRVRGPVVDVQFERDKQPELFTTLRVGAVGVDVIQLLEPRLARTVVYAPPSSRGATMTGAMGITKIRRD